MYQAIPIASSPFLHYRLVSCWQKVNIGNTGNQNPPDLKGQGGSGYLFFQYWFLKAGNQRIMQKWWIRLASLYIYNNHAAWFSSIRLGLFRMWSDHVDHGQETTEVSRQKFCKTNGDFKLLPTITEFFYLPFLHHFDLWSLKEFQVVK